MIVLAEADAVAAGHVAAVLTEEPIARATSSHECAAFFRLRAVDALVTNIRLMDGSSIPMVRAVRASGSPVPIVIYAVAELPVRTVLSAFDAGVDEVVSNVAMRWEELAARVRLVLARNKASTDARVCVGDIVIDRAGLVVMESGHARRLTSDQFFLLECLAQRADSIVVYDDLARYMKRQTMRVISNHALREAIRRLRACLLHPRRIQTVRNRGYVLLSKCGE